MSKFLLGRREITVDTNQTTSCQISLSYFVNDYSIPGKWQSLVTTTQPLYKSKNAVHRVAIKDLYTPAWWFRENNLQRKNLPNIDYSQLANIDFSNGEDQLHGMDHTIAIKSIRFVSKPLLSATLFSSLFIGYSLFILLVLVLKKRFKSLPLIKQRPLSNVADDEYNRVAEFMGENFHLKTLNAGLVAEKTGVSSAKLTVLLHTFRGQNYNQFINAIRLKEAKRLLRETDRNVSEISSEVGYAYVNSFNRVFKEAEGMAPLEYRSDK